MGEVVVTQADRALLDAIYNGDFAFKPKREREVLGAFARHREQARREGLEDAVREVEAWFPCGTIDKPEFAAGKALREAIRKLKGD